MDTSPTFHLGINMPGAVSAGAYTAGALDFLLEALDAWEKAKVAAGQKLGPPVPTHNVSIDVLSGTSAGGVVAALAALDLHYGGIADQSSTAGKEPANTPVSRVRSAWVDLLDIRPMLTTCDLTDVHDLSDIKSVLNSDALVAVGRQLAVPQPVMRPLPPYVSPTLTLTLTLSNLRGVPYSIAEANLGSPEQRIRYYADSIQFEFVAGSGKAADPNSIPVRLDSADANDPAWDVFRTATTATGAFPFAFAPRILRQRPIRWYTDHLWTVPGGDPILQQKDPVLVNQPLTKKKIEPDFGSELGAAIDTLNVDGGATNNDPFECARGFLANKLLGSDLLHFPREAREVFEAVLSIAPFPGDGPYDPAWDPAKHSGLLDVASGVLSALIAQSRFTGESLSLLKEDKAFSRFVVAPDAGTSEVNRKGRPLPALQGAALGAFAGFLCKGFREHDYLLGRRNCQRFLTVHFVLPESNRIIRRSLENNPDASAILQQFQVPAPDRPSARGVPLEERWLPVVPLCTAALRQEIPLPKRAALKPGDLNAIGDLIGTRLKLILAPVAASFMKAVPGFVRGVLVTFIANHLRTQAQKFISDALDDA